MNKFIPAGLAGIAVCACFAQTATAPACEVASVKYDPRKAGSWIKFEAGGRLDASSWLKQLIQVAYDVNDYQVSGGPAWLGDDWYAIEAKAPDANAGENRMKLMLRTLARRAVPASPSAGNQKFLRIPPCRGKGRTKAEGAERRRDERLHAG